jgi:hypothetical protein
MPTNVVYRRSAPRKRFARYFDLATKIVLGLVLIILLTYAAVAIQIATHTQTAYDIGLMDHAGGSLERHSNQQPAGFSNVSARKGDDQ